MSKMKKSILFNLSVVLLLSLILGGWGLSGDAASAAETPKNGGILKIIDPLPPMVPFGDPLSVFGPGVFRASVALERLWIPGDKLGTFKYILATGYRLAEDESYYDIELRKGVKFHDGTDFNAEAAKWNLDRGLAAKRSEFSDIGSFQVIDEYTLRVHLKSWNNQILYNLSHDDCMMISPTAFEKNGGADWATLNPVGTGAFRFKEIKNNQIIVFEKNPDYWQKGLPHLDGFECHIIMENMIISAALKKGEAHGTWMGSFDMANEFSKDPKFRVWGSDEDFTLLMSFNTENPKSAWSDVRVRQALEYAIDKENIYQKMGKGYFRAKYSIICGLESLITLQNIPRKYDPVKAKKLLEEAGYPDGFDFALYVHSAVHVSPYSDFVTIMQEQAAQVGLRFTVEQVDAGRFQELESNPMVGNDGRLGALRGDSKNPAGAVLENLVPGVIFGVGMKRPDEWTELIPKMLKTKNPEEQLSILVQMEKIAYDFAMYMPMSNNATMGILLKNIKNVNFNRFGFDIAEAWIAP